ncbi:MULTISPECIES: hypothetical protein [unclassified Francisella]|uniref:hypothetical protein n=1 Tax=unclassified Francisella TaxID=2610885 RepID=UPI002E30952E|nr:MULTISPECIES: hypothetical protein [unclassified Francisella]MED7820208.1 hypothetical protein [Francisella sp. 19S2-4]MED7831044.1 hypothetical protein [Francisella sp. 19S2-10]
MFNKFKKALVISWFLLISLQSYAVTDINTNSNKSVNSIIKSLQKEVTNLQIEAKNINNQDSKDQQPSFVMYNNVVVRHNYNETPFIN